MTALNWVPAPSFSAVLLGGGASRRMGRDKALLRLSGSCQPLWQHQAQLLEALRPDELFWSGPSREGLPEAFTVVPDARPGTGPLGGISACLDVLQSELLVVLAIDLPHMSTAFLKELVSLSENQVGAVVRHGDFYEPLAAVYPRCLRDLAQSHLAQGRYALQDFIITAVEEGALKVVPLKEQDQPLFQNLNTPEDVAEAAGRPRR